MPNTRLPGVSAHSLEAESCKIPARYQGLGHDCSSSNQRGRPSCRRGTTAMRYPCAHTFNTIHSAGIRRSRAAHQRSGTFSLHPKDTREEHRVEASAVAFVWPKNTSAEHERRWRPRWGSRAEPHEVRAMIHMGERE